MHTDTDIAWMAGFFEGEGTLGFGGNARRYPFIDIHQCNREPLERCERLFGGNLFSRTYQQNPKHRPQHVWRLGGEECQALLRAMWPYLSDYRRQQAEPAFAWVRRQARVAACGTNSGYFRHRRHGEQPCDACREAHNLTNRRRTTTC